MTVSVGAGMAYCLCQHNSRKTAKLQRAPGLAVPHAPAPDQRGEILPVPEPAAQEPVPLLFEIQAAVVNQEDIWRELEQQEEAAPAHPLPALKQESAASYSCCDRAGPSAPVDEHLWAAADTPPLASEHAEAEDPQTLLATKLWLKYDRNPERLLKDASDILKFNRTILTRVRQILQDERVNAHFEDA
ncbi:hypothetical protein MRB53_023556 [Persea americana]|uniref:Uncharacterized protein n=1 Tax=Persea americana TaxID=3435 RepID=A0ACC2LAA3_PERAE|nr:hypothetical protein MRB53_023556 [Persea americana]